MLDRLFVKNSAPKDVFTAEYTPEQAVTGHELINENGQNLRVLFPPWHGGGRLYKRLIKRLATQGDAVLAYYFHDEILKPNADMVQASYAYLRDTIVAELTEVTDSHDYERVQLIAMSLGNPALATVTGKFGNFDSASLMCTASSLARSTWHGTRTQHIRSGIEQNGHDLAYVEEAWQDIAPINHLDALIGKEVSVLVSLRDEVIPTCYQMEFIDAAQEAGVNPNVQMTRLGHYAAIGSLCLYGKV